MFRGEEARGVCRSRGRLKEHVPKAEAPKRFQAKSADEFAADSMPWILPGLPDRHGHVALPEPDAERESRQSASDNGDGFQRAHSRVMNSLRHKDVRKQAKWMFL